MHSSDRAPMTRVIADIEQARRVASECWVRNGDDQSLGRANAYADALQIIEKRFPEMFQESRPSLASRSF